MKQIFALIAAVGLVFNAAHAEEPPNADQVREALSRSMPDLPISSISESPVPGLYELVTGGQIYYITTDGRYVIEGSIIDVERRLNLTQQRRGRTQLADINAIGDNRMVLFEPEAGQDRGRTITVFTDTTCPYCSKLHQEVDGLLSQGIRVRYLLYPRAGLNSPAHRILESVWCAEDQQQAMTMAKAGQRIPELRCENPIEQHIEMARKVGLQGTPMIFLDNGLIIPGYRPGQELVKLLASQPRI